MSLPFTYFFFFWIITKFLKQKLVSFPSAYLFSRCSMALPTSCHWRCLCQGIPACQGPRAIFSPYSAIFLHHSWLVLILYLSGCASLVVFILVAIFKWHGWSAFCSWSPLPLAPNSCWGIFTQCPLTLSYTLVISKFILLAHTGLLQLKAMYSASCYIFLMEYSMNFRYNSWKLSSLFLFSSPPTYANPSFSVLGIKNLIRAIYH